jgi:hypothetical protein
MEKKERVVVVVQLERKKNSDGKTFASSIRALGLTGYGDTLKDSTLKVARMFAAFVEVNRKYNTLEDQLNKSGLRWYWESEYKGGGLKSAEVFTTEGSVGIIEPDGHPNEVKELELAA